MTKRVTIYLEISALLLLLLFAERMARGTITGYVDVHPNPLWLVVFFGALGYGGAAGVFAGGLCALTKVAMDYYQADHLGMTTFWTLERLTLPMLFMFVALIVSEWRERINRRQSRQDGRLQELQELNQKRRDELGHFAELKKQWDQRTVNQLTTFSSLYRAAGKLDSLEVHELHRGILEIASDYLHATQCALYIRERSIDTEAGIDEGNAESNRLKFRRVCYMVNGEYRKQDDKDEDNPPPGGGVIEQCLRTGQVASVGRINQLQDFVTAAVADFALLAGPVRGYTGQIEGILVINQMPFLEYTPANVRLFEMLVDWSATSLNNALFFHDVKQRNIDDEILGCYNQQYYEKRIREEFSRSLRYEFPLSLLLFEIEDFDAVEESQYLNLLRAVSGVLARSLRDVDIVCSHDKRGKWWIILPTTPRAGSAVVRERMLELMSGFDFRYADQKSVKFGIRISCSKDEGVETPEALEAAFG